MLALAISSLVGISFLKEFLDLVLEFFNLLFLSLNDLSQLCDFNFQFLFIFNFNRLVVWSVIRGYLALTVLLFVKNLDLAISEVFLARTSLCQLFIRLLLEVFNLLLKLVIFFL